MIEDISLFERLARVAQIALKMRGRDDRLVAQLARIDQIIASRKDSAGILGKDDCTYLSTCND